MKRKYIRDGPRWEERKRKKHRRWTSVGREVEEELWKMDSGRK